MASPLMGIMPGHMMNPWLHTSELIFTIIAMAFCAAIYYKTKGLYDLTKHKGIRYFREAFLFFGLSYLGRFLFSFMMFATDSMGPFRPKPMLGPWFMLVMSYFSTIAIFYLIFSSIWKRFDSKKMLYLGHGLAIALSVAAFVTRSHQLLTILQTIMLVIALVLNFIIRDKTRKKNKLFTQTRILYLLVSALWLINLWILSNNKPLFSFWAEIMLELLSLAVFFIIYRRISKWTR